MNMKKKIMGIILCMLLIQSAMLTTMATLTDDLVVDAGGPYEGVVGEEIQFDGTATGGTPPYSFHWDFGNGDTSELEDPKYAFNETEEFDITLIVIDSTGVMAIDETIAIITEADTMLAIRATGGLSSAIITISNTGEVDALDVTYKINLTGGILGRINKQHEGEINRIASGESIELEVSPLFGLGLLVVDGFAKAINTGYISIHQGGYIILIFVVF
jgi:hypothetical protein